MIQEAIRAEISKAYESPDGGNYRMGTIAFHLLGDMSMPNEDIFYSDKETDDYYIGSWIEGIGAFNVLFPKSTSRRLTPEEVEKYSEYNYQLADHEPQKLTDLK